VALLMVKTQQTPKLKQIINKWWTGQLTKVEKISFWLQAEIRKSLTQFGNKELSNIYGISTIRNKFDLLLGCFSRIIKVKPKMLFVISPQKKKKEK
jgi:hypothetical protein